MSISDSPPARPEWVRRQLRRVRARYASVEAQVEEARLYLHRTGGQSPLGIAHMERLNAKLGYLRAANKALLLELAEDEG
ncbi:MAG: hypothetical protein JWN86_721 [Planctomycetota bacterium]|nr:hypothetical protein [Planctomycetota bacterium]